MNFLDLTQIEPALIELESDILNEGVQLKAEGRNYFCANYRWIANPAYKRRMCKLVGDGAASPVLRTSKAYNVAYDHLYALLPDCFNCNCVGVTKGAI